jgi:hypothetical protein
VRRGLVAIAEIGSIQRIELDLRITSPFVAPRPNAECGPAATSVSISPFLFARFIANRVAEVLDILSYTLDSVAPARKSSAAQRHYHCRCCEKSPSCFERHIRLTF